MSEPKRNISDLLSENRLCEWLELEVPDQGKRNRRLTNWIAQGLPHVEMSGLIFFFGTDVVEFMEDRSVRSTE